MAIVSEELYSLLVPLQGERIIVPRACVAEVVRYNPDSSAPADSAQPDWQHGTLTWREQDVPVVCLEALLGLPLPNVGGRSRVVVFNPLTGVEQCPHYGVLAQGFPQMVRINSEVVQLDESYTAPADVPIICQILMLNEHALIPDLEALEARINAAVPVSID